MSYALRNALILLTVLGILLFSGWGYIHFVQGDEIATLNKQLTQEQQKLRKDQNIADQYDSVVRQYAIIQTRLNLFDKVLFPSLDASDVFAYLDHISQGNAFLNINFTFIDSVKHKKYGVIRSRLVGQGNYRNLYNLIYILEHSRAIDKINELVINPVNQLSKYNQVNYTFRLDSYYERTHSTNQASLSLSTPHLRVRRNPFYPLIRSVEPNKDNLINVEKSKLIAVGFDFVFLVDQNGRIDRLTTGDKVYLGTLNSVNMKNRTATFVLNKGGIIDKVTLKVKVQ